jgi:hypothetical protein
MLFRYPAWLWPGGHRLWWQIISHKYLRLLAPFLFLSAFAANLFLTACPLYAVCLALQIAFFLVAALGLLPPARRWKFCKLPAGFVFLNLQVVRGLRYYLAGAGRQGWQ